MIKNLLLVALRNFQKDKGYSFLNILGLTIGITFSLFLIFYIKDELSFDRHNEKADRIVRINSYIKEPENAMNLAITQGPLAPTLKKDFPEVESAVRFAGNPRIMFKNGELHLYEEKIYYTDSNVFKIFTCQFVEGSPDNALTEPKSLVLTQSSAAKYFGKNKSVVGQSLRGPNNDLYKITAVIKDLPKTTQLTFNGLISITTFPPDFGTNWGNFNFYTYALLRPNVNRAAFEKKLVPMYDKYMAPVFAQFNIKIWYGVQALTDIHLRSELTNEPGELGSMSYIYIFGAVALFMLIIACINYMNLTTARSARRAKEIGIRKVTGSTKSQLVAQFLIESLLTAFFALLLSVGLVALLLPTFNSLSGKFIPFQTLLQPGTILILLSIILFVGLAGGSYPAFYLSKFNPISILKGSLSKSSSNVNLRRGLVVVQFSISMIMLICTWVVYGQLKYLRNKDMGFNKEQVVSMNVDDSNGDMRSKILAFKNELVKNSKIKAITTSQSRPGSQNMNVSLFTLQTKKGAVDKGITTYGIDEDFFKTLGMTMNKGRNFSGAADTLRSIIVNENLVKSFGWDNPIGQKVKFGGDTSGNYLEVVGVVKDFNQRSLYNPIEPLILFYRPNSTSIQAKLDAANITATTKEIEQTWKASFPDLPFQFTFLDQDFDSQYAADQKRGKIFTTFSILTILITCLGLLGLIAFTTQQRQKEISIRKIMGAGLQEIIPLITMNFIYLVALSCLIAFPVAWYFMNAWLKIFPYNTGLGVLPFILSALIVLAITLLTVIFHTIKAGLANPVTSLRSE